MRLLFHHDQASYDATNKIYNFTTSDNLQNPTQVVLQDCIYKATTMELEELYPHTIYLRSKALTDMQTQDHTTEVLSNGSKIRSTVIATLTHYAFGKYKLKRRYTFPVNKHRTNKIFDFQFCDQFLALGNYVGGLTFSTLQDLHTAGEIIFFVDYSVGTIKNTAGNNAAIGDSVGNIYSRLPGGTVIDFVPISPSVIEFVALNSEVNGITGDNTWEAMADNTNGNNPNFTTESGMTFLLKTGTDDLNMLFKIGTLKIYRYANKIQIHPAVGGGYSIISAIVVADNADYVVQLWWSMENENSGVYEMTVSCRTYTPSTNRFSSTLTVGPFDHTPNFGAYRISSAQTHINETLGLFCVHKNTESTRNTLATYMIEKYDGESGIDNAVDAEFQIQLEVK